MKVITPGTFLLLLVTASSVAAVTEGRQLSIHVSCNNNNALKVEEEPIVVLNNKSNNEDDLKVVSQCRQHGRGDDNGARSLWWRPKHANAATILKHTSSSSSSSLDTNTDATEEPKSCVKGIMFASTAKRIGFQPGAASSSRTPTHTTPPHCEVKQEPNKSNEGADNKNKNRNHKRRKNQANRTTTTTTTTRASLDSEEEDERETITNNNNIQQEQQAATVVKDDGHHLKHEQNATVHHHYNATASVTKQNRSISLLESERRWGKDGDDSSSSRRRRRRRRGEWKTHPALTRTDIVLASIIRKINTLLLWSVT